MRTSGSKRVQSEELPPDQAAQACQRTAEELQKRGFDIEAVAHYERARQLVPSTADVAWRLAILQDRLGNGKAASEEFAKAVELAPKDADVLNDAGYFAVNRGEMKTAEKHLKEAIRIRPDHASAWVNLALVYAKTGRWSEAESSFAKVMPPSQSAYNVAVLLAGQGQTAQAKARLQQVIAQDPDFAAAQELLAKLPTS